jgi:hypothetical protein
MSEQPIGSSTEQVDSPIDDAMLESYWEDGFVVVRGLVERASIDPWLGRLADIVEGRVAPAEGMLVMKDVMVAKGAVSPETKLEAIAKIQDF